jgi:hypothetical protein
MRDMTTAAGFLSERRDFLHVHATRSVSGEGWDVVLRVDGTYHDPADAEGAAASIRDRLDALTDVRQDGRVWWSGPPWQQQSETPR